MRAQVLQAARRPLELRELADPVPGPGQVGLLVLACGVCRTEITKLGCGCWSWKQ